MDNPIYITQDNVNGTEGAEDVEHSESVLLRCSNAEESVDKENQLIEEEVLYEEN